MPTLRDLLALAIALTVLVALCAFTRQAPTVPNVQPERGELAPLEPDEFFILNPELSAEAA